MGRRKVDGRALSIQVDQGFFAPSLQPKRYVDIESIVLGLLLSSTAASRSVAKDAAAVEYKQYVRKESCSTVAKKNWNKRRSASRISTCSSSGYPRCVWIITPSYFAKDKLDEILEFTLKEHNLKSSTKEEV